MAILTFIEKYDLSGKTIIPFYSHDTDGFTSSLWNVTTTTTAARKISAEVKTEPTYAESNAPCAFTASTISVSCIKLT